MKRFVPRTMWMRLTAGLVLLLLAACIVVGVVTSVALHGFLLTRLDQQLDGAGGRFASSIQRGTDGSASGSDNGPGPGQAVGTLGVQLTAGTVSQAVVVQDDGANRTVTFTGADLIALECIPTTRTARTINLVGLGEYRIEAMNGPGAVVQLTGLPLAPLQQTVNRLLVIEMAVFGSVLVVGAAAAALVVRFTLRPLRRVTAAALPASELPLASGEVSFPARDPVTQPGTEVGQVSAAFNQLLDQVETALGARQQTEDRLRRFVADASHELRTPVATIRGHAELARRVPGDLPPVVANALVRVESEAIRMGRLVDDLLLLARLDAGRPLESEPVELTLIAIDSVSDAHVAAPDHVWRLELPDEPIDTMGDGYRLRQVLANLLANARTHTPPGTTVTVSLHRIATDEAAGDQLELVVADDGPGIPTDLQPRLFERFARAEDSRSRRSGGTGLGLAIAHGIVKAHGGQLTVQSRPGDTRFRVLLPGAADATNPRDVHSDVTPSA